MKEVLTKSFWQGVKKTYDDALKGPMAVDGDVSPSPTPEEPSSNPETAAPPASSAEQEERDRDPQSS